MTQALPGIWFWEAPHPDWHVGDSWEQSVRSWAIRTDIGLVLVDPLIRDDLDPTVAWETLDGLAAAHGPVHAVIRTLHYHHRSAAQVSARYDVPIYARPLPRDDIPVHPFDMPVSNHHDLLGGLIAHHVHRDDELVLWIPSQRALLFSDVGQRRDGRFELCPDWWLREADSWGALREQIVTLVALEPEHLLVSHGPHLLGDGGELAPAAARAAARPLPPFISLDEANLRRENITLVDARIYLDDTDEREAYDAAHLAGAVFLDFERTLSGDPGSHATQGRHPLPSPERFAAGLSAAGISDGDTIVAYDDGGGVLAARLVWMLRAIGEDAALLNPVPDSWASTPVPVPTPGHFSPRPWPEDRLASIEDVTDRGADTVLLDARAPARYAGGPDPFDPRSGHIPGAVNVPCRANLSEDATRLAPMEEIWDRYEAAGITPGTDVISSCGSGVTACHNLLTLEALRLGPGRLYVGSFSEWSRDPDREVATDR